MKKTLRDITDETLRVMEAIDLADGEITPEIESALAITQANRDQKAMAYLETIESNDAMLARIKKETDRLNAMKKRLTDKNNFLKANLLSAIKIMGEFMVGTTTFTTRKSKRLVIDEAVAKSLTGIPSEFVTEKTTKSIDKNKITKALKEGRTINGCELVDNQNLYIK